MLNDAAHDQFDITLAWREDRLYRGMRAMLLVLETIQEHRILVMLARETFDPKIAPLRAWVAQLDGRKERMTMGVKADKANTGQDRYGYQRVGDQIVVVEEEVKWIREVFEWYLQGCRLMEIRERLIAADAHQKGSSIHRMIQWARFSIQAILKAAKEYAYGIKVQSRKGEIFEIPVDPIIDVAYERFVEMRAKKKPIPLVDFIMTICLADLRAGIDELRNAAPQSEEERHDMFLLKKQMVDTLLERATINKDREIKVEIRVNFLAILEQDAGSEDPNRGAYSKLGEICNCIPDLYPAGRILIEI